jgi:plastocyanin
MQKTVAVFLFSLSIFYYNCAAAGETKSAAHSVKIDSLAYDPAAISIKSGETVEWKNTDIVPHTVTSLDGKIDSKVILPGASWQMSFSNPGTIQYSCQIHPNMKGSISIN